jgi:hypothetical protein
MFLFVLLCFIGLTILLWPKKPRSNTATTHTHSNPAKNSSSYDYQKEQAIINEIQRKEDNPPMDDDEYYVFSNHIDKDFEDMNHLTPSQALAELNKRKKEGEYIPKREYRGYMDVIASKNDEKYINQILLMTDDELHKWFDKKISNGTKFSSRVWNVVATTLAPHHEPVLLDMLEKIAPAKVKSWVADKKHEGYFFSNVVYKNALEKYKQRRIRPKKTTKNE